MNETELCRRCLLKDAKEDEIFAQVQKAISRLKKSEKVQQNEYARRLELCKKCEHLLAGCCIKCGCYVELRAMLKNSSCPLSKSNKKW